MKQERDTPYIWVTWVTKIITGEQQCEFVAWLKAHYKLDKASSTFNSRQWNIDHTQLLRTRRDEMEKKGYEVRLEDQNSFKMHLGDALLSGKADLVSLVRDPDGIILRGIVDDCKTGRPKDSDQVQVMLYMLSLPVSVIEYAGHKFDGNVVYKDHVVPIAWEEIDSNFRDIVRDLLTRIKSDKPCKKVPSYNECKWCDVLKVDCPEKVE